MTITTLLAAFVSLSFANEAKKPTAYPVLIEVRAARSDKGVVHCSLFETAEGFPSKHEMALRVAQATLKNGAATCSFPDISPGKYAVSVFHDEDGDGKMAVGIFGIPKEGVGASTDPKARWGPPRFEDSQFEVRDRPVAIPATLKYL